MMQAAGCLFLTRVFPDPELHLQRITEGSEKLFLFPAPLDFDYVPSHYFRQQVRRTLGSNLIGLFPAC